jgi:hypothetical protein
MTVETGRALPRTAAPERFVALAPGQCVLRDFVLRSAGFALDDLAALRLDPETLAATRAAVSAVAAHRAALRRFEEQAFADMRRDLRAADDGSVDGRAAIKAFNRVVKALRKGRPLPDGDDVATAVAQAGGSVGRRFAAAVDDCEATRLAAARNVAEAERQFGPAFNATRRALWARTAQDDFQDALFLSNATLWEMAQRFSPPADGARNTKMRQREETLWMYLQRLAAKNETNAFFGPINYGRLSDEPEADPVRTDMRPDSAFAVAYAAEWLVADLAAAIADDPRLAEIVPLVRRGTRRRQDIGQAVGDGHSLRRLRAAGGEGTACDIDRALAARRLERRVVVPAEAVDQLDALRRAVAELGPETPEERAAVAGWQDLIDEVDALRTEFAGVGGADKRRALQTLEAVVTDRLGTPARRNAGRMFRTRQALYEDGFGGGTTTLAEELLGHVAEDLRAVSLAARAEAHHTQRIDMARATAFFDRAFAGRAGVPYDVFVKAMSDAAPGEDTDDIDALTLARDRFRARWRDALARATEDDRWSPAALQGLSEGLTLDPAWVMSPDLLLARDGDGGYRWVLGEVHHGITADGWMLAFHPDRQKIRAAIDAHLAGLCSAGGCVAANLVLARQMKTAPQVYPGIVVEMNGQAAGRPERPPLGLGDLRVVRAPGGLRLVDPVSKREVRFYPPAFGFNAESYRPFSLFSFPIPALPPVPAGQTAPRFGRPRFVVARARWWLPAAELDALSQAGAPAAQYLALRRWADERGLPPRGFAKFPSQPKPVFVDLDTPLSLQAMLASRGAGEDGVLTEMLPDGDALWFAPDGRARTSELRLLMTGGGGDA